MRWAILDSNIYIGHWERGQFDDLLSSICRSFVVRHSAVVLSELRRGARTREAERLVAALYRIASPLWEPSADDWWKAGKLIREIGDTEGWDTARRREFQNDAVIALTARRYGASVVTANRRDFDCLARQLRIQILWAQ